MLKTVTVLKTIVFFLLISTVMGCVTALPDGTEEHLNQSYGPHSRNKLDVYLPETRDNNTETVLLIHGGAWVSGDKTNADLMHKRNTLLESGYAVASMNYRYASEDYHDQMEDVGNALALLQDESNNWTINHNRFALVGVSAGGHLSMLYGHAFDETDIVKTVVSIVGPTNFTDSVFFQFAENNGVVWTVEQLLGATFEEDSALYAEASPLFNTSDCPTFLVYGGMDELVPNHQGIEMFDALTANGVPTDTTITAQGTHNVNGPNNMYRDQVELEIVGWLNTHLDQ